MRNKRVQTCGRKQLVVQTFYISVRSDQNSNLAERVIRGDAFNTQHQTGLTAVSFTVGLTVIRRIVFK